MMIDVGIYIIRESRVPNSAGGYFENIDEEYMVLEYIEPNEWRVTRRNKIFCWWDERSTVLCKYSEFKDELENAFRFADIVVTLYISKEQGTEIFIKSRKYVPMEFMELLMNKLKEIVNIQ